MSENVLRLHKSAPADDVVSTLRRVADEIEAGEIEWPVTTAVLVLGHTDAEVPDGDDRVQQIYWQTYGMGSRTDVFTVRGVLATVLNSWSDDD